MSGLLFTIYMESVIFTVLNITSDEVIFVRFPITFIK
jgi:hypothetical protein